MSGFIHPFNLFPNLSIFSNGSAMMRAICLAGVIIREDALDDRCTGGGKLLVVRRST